MLAPFFLVFEVEGNAEVEGIAKVSETKPSLSALALSFASLSLSLLLALALAL
jgi:hypothetical protein